eukprot:2045504-Pyramimonas_sp.AAC.2
MTVHLGAVMSQMLVAPTLAAFHGLARGWICSVHQPMVLSMMLLSMMLLLISAFTASIEGGAHIRCVVGWEVTWPAELSYD